MNQGSRRRRSIALAASALWLIAISAIFITGSLWAIGTSVARLALVGWLICVAGLAAASVIVIRAALNLPGGADPRTEAERQVGKRFGWVVGAEVLALAVVNPVAAATGNFSLMPSLNLIVVGLHFLPLARIFRVPRYYLMGVLFCVLPLTTLLAMPKDFVVGHTLAWYVVPILGCGLVATVTGAAGLRESWRSASEIRASAL